LLELPDLEVVKDILTPRIVGRTVRGVEVNRADLLQTGESSLVPPGGQEVGVVASRGMYLFMSFGAGSELVLHPMRWAWLWHGPLGYVPSTATDLRLTFDDGTDLRLIERRSPRLARAWVGPGLASSSPLKDLGVDPLAPEFTVASLERAVHGRRRILKHVLTDQTSIAGIGSVYADEILFRAKLSPVRFAHTLTSDEIHRLWHEVGGALRWAISEIRARVGNELFDREVRDFLHVHGKRDAPCPDCGTSVAEFLHDGEQTNYCPQCQETVLPTGTDRGKAARR